MSLLRKVSSLSNISDKVGLDQAASFLNTILVVTTLQVGITVSLISTVGVEIPYDNSCTESSIKQFWSINSVSVCLSSCITIWCFIILAWTTYVSASDEEAIESFMDSFGIDMILLCLLSIVNFWLLGICILYALCFFIAKKEYIDTYCNIFIIFTPICIIIGLYILYRLLKIKRKRHVNEQLRKVQEDSSSTTNEQLKELQVNARRI